MTPAALRDPTYAAVIASQCDVIVPEGALKWSALRPSPKSYDYSDADEFVAFATSHRLSMRGHTLVWHHELPSWFPAVATKANARSLLSDHIHQVVSRYAGRIRSWDVVNEVVSLASGRSDGLRDTPWLRLIGEAHIALAFRVASAADPKAVLTYNETSIEADTAEHEARRRAVLALLRGLLQKGVPIDALGIQSHLDGIPGNRYKRLRRFLAEVADLGLRIIVTELDVNDQSLPADIPARDAIVAAVYRDYLAVVLDEPAVEAVLTWGLSDRQTWLRRFAPRSDGLAVRPLPLDTQLQPKPAYWAMLQALGRAPARAG